MDYREGSRFIELRSFNAPNSTFINPDNIVSVTGWSERGADGAMLKMPDGTVFRTRESVESVLALIEGKIAREPRPARVAHA